VLAYGIVGGMPAYLGRLDERDTLEENLLREVLRPEGYPFDEVHYLLHTELTNPSTYSSILAAVARGAERVGDVALAVGAPTANAPARAAWEREVPLTTDRRARAAVTASPIACRLSLPSRARTSR
jgi:AAA+ ATPase superfamily predicted ATPase